MSVAVKRWAAALVFALCVATSPIVPTPATSGGADFVLSPENNHLWAYDAASGARQLVARAVNGPDPGVAAPNGLRRDINGQICVAPDGSHIITGEDTVVAPPGGGAGGDSHDPRIAGWGYFEIAGNTLGQLAITETGKLAPAAGAGPGYRGDPDNYGCGFLDAQRLLTTAIGDTLPGQPANGQLFLWFAPFTGKFREVTDAATHVSFYAGQVSHCEIDGSLATAGGIAVAPNGDVYLTANRPDLAGSPSAVWRYRGRWPRSASECTPDYVARNVTRQRVIPALPLLPVDPHAPTPSSVAISRQGTLAVASVFSGTVSEFAVDGTWQRDLYPSAPIAVPGGPLGNTPYGLAFTRDGTLWIADLGIVGDAPASGKGSLIRLRFDGNGAPLAPEVVRDGLTFPDGLGVYAPRPAVDVDGATGAPSTGLLPVSGRSQRSAAVVVLLLAAVVALRVRRAARPKSLRQCSA